MRRFARPKPAFFILLLIALATAGVVAQQFRLFERAWFNWQTWRHPADERSIGLADYRVVLEGRVIEGLNDNVSALTYDPVRKSLFTVTNKNAELIELSLEGKVLRRIALVGFGDAEAVEFISDNIYVISDEAQQRLIKVHVNDDTQFLDAADAEQM
ncbi:SdiA-regulated domain-containing protein, partial [Pseudomonas tolaasii]